MSSLRIKNHGRTFQIIILGFFSIILTGTLLLMMPFSSAHGQWTSFLDALFTATSATCVTGLIVFDTATYWSTIGQVIILSLIQIGGAGVITIVFFFMMLSGRKIGLMSRGLLKDATGAPQIGGIFRFLWFIIRTSLLVETVGALFLMPTFCKDFGVGMGIWYSFFHSISAFCNAGFDLMGIRAPFSSLTSYVGNFNVTIVISLLIVIGGFGFLTWSDMIENKFRYRRLRLQAKMIIITTTILLVGGFIYFYFFEFGFLPGKERVLASIFQSVTPRTAGFNTVDYNKVSEAGLLITILLMLVGGAPGSTAGGFKVTTLFIIFATAISTLRQKEDTNCFGRRLDSTIVKNAVTLLLLYGVLALGGAIVISRAEQLPMIVSLFESASGVGTVGLTMGITPGLHTVSKIVLIVNMFFGRVGAMTFAYAAVKNKDSSNARLPQGKVMVG